ncbi:thioredoxin reductase 1, cytoplasmic-like [Watersipora subatra]|uniref:thioredoxin reductase 1, cytoplasmic-like n=1 Tax=Watersipora subatra TaxID=2589382 RepID=UPI00355BE95D
MPPTGDQLDGSKAAALVKEKIKAHTLMVFSKSYCPYCIRLKELFKTLNLEFEALELDLISGGSEIQHALHELSGQKTVPNVYIKGKHIGGSDDVTALHRDNKLLPLLEESHDFQYDVIVIGGGSGGLSAAKEAAALGRRVAVCDFVKPSPAGTTWGLGGTCVNVGCIPKKLMHHAALLGHHLKDAREYGWNVDSETVKHNWQTLKTAVQDHIGGLNWGYRVQLRDNNVKYLNAYAQFLSSNTVKTVNKRGKEEVITAQKFIIATGLRPRILDIPGSEFVITSDDLFSLSYCPGKTLCVGASYISLECGGFLAGIGLDVTVMVRSILLRGFDQQCAELIGKYMGNNGVKFQRHCVPTKIEKLKSSTEDTPGLYRVTSKSTDGNEHVEEYNTILMAIGREACTDDLGLETVGVLLDSKSKKLIGSEAEQTNIAHVYGIGDVLQDKPELTPVAIQAGRLLSRRLFGGQKELTDYSNIATTVFTPLEYGCIGLSEEEALAKYGAEDLEVYHSHFTPLEWTVPHREENACYAKLICVKSLKEKVVGFHILGDQAGEITQGFSVAMRCGATKADFDATIGIHPTSAEIFTTLDITKSSGKNALKTGC